jgi:hypothetical protein
VIGKKLLAVEEPQQVTNPPNWRGDQIGREIEHGPDPAIVILYVDDLVESEHEQAHSCECEKDMVLREFSHLPSPVTNIT